MCASEDGVFLVTGDTQGYVKVWDISEYCIEDAPSGKPSLFQFVFVLIVWLSDESYPHTF